MWANVPELDMSQMVLGKWVMCNTEKTENEVSINCFLLKP